MTRVRKKGFQIFKDRHGKARCYHRATRTAVDLSKTPVSSAAFIADMPTASITTPACAAIHDKAAKRLGWRQANMVCTFLSEVFKQCNPLGWIDKTMPRT